jgi:hypothetical protein
MTLARILVVCALLPQPAHPWSAVQSPPLTQENTAPQGASPTKPDKDEPQQAPSTASPAEPSNPAPSNSETGSQKAPTAAAEPTSQPPAAPPQKPVAKPSLSGKKPAGKKKPTSSPTKRVVRNGGTADPTVQLAPGVSQKQASIELQETSHLLALTDANLKNLSRRQLSTNQQNVVSQIQQFMEQSHQAADQGDPVRAHTLAVKAHLLSDDLMKH